MKPSQLARTLESLLKAKQPVMIWGSPGGGKSSVVKQVADRMFGSPKLVPRGKMGQQPVRAIHFIDLRLPLLDAVDLRGLPNIEGGKTQWIPPAFLPTNESIKAGIHAAQGVLFLDEIVQAPPSVQNAASQLLLDRRLGEYVLPDGWVMVAAGNRETDRAATNKMPSHIANRFTHLNFEVDAQDWIDWAFDNNLNSMTIAFVGFRPDCITKGFDPKEKANCTARSIHFLSNILNADDGVDNLTEVAEGTIGSKWAVEFTGFVRVFREMPDYDEVKKRPDTIKVPEQVDARYAVATMLAGRAQPEDMKQIVKYIDRMPTEFQILTMNDMTLRNKRLAETSTYITWASQHKDVLLNSTVR